ncbi:MAG: hypothetical protein ACRD3J_17355 [Thermoanaerobaculia bacterium]
MDGYPDSFGSHRASVFPHQGPASYVQVTEGTAPALATDGDEVQAIEAGMKYFEYVSAGLTDSATYRVECIPETISGVVAAPASIPQPSLAYRLRWVVVATGAEVAAEVDLSDEIIRLFAVGPK